MKTLVEKIGDLNNLILQGKALEAFEKYYHDDVVMQENEYAPTVGKTANKKREVEFLSSTAEFRKAAALKVTTGDDVTMVEWHYDYTHKEWGSRNYKQMSVQEWKDGRIIKEKFYYNA